jgi:molybdenum cofactor cytidylyltransferase
VKFGPVPLADASGAILAHSVGGLKKGRTLSAEDVAKLQRAGIEQVVAARLEAGDVPEDEAATAVAEAAAGDGVTVQAAFTGRCNLYAKTGVYAKTGGVVVIERERVDAINLVDEAVTIATVGPYDLVEPGTMLATVKIIPFAAPRDAVDACVTIAAADGPLLRVAPLQARAVGLAMTRLAGTKESVLDKTVKTLEARLTALGSTLKKELRVAHDTNAVAAAIKELEAAGCAPILVFGASAIQDRRDVVPAAIEQAGGRVDHFGMPVDPGNLLLLGHLGPTVVLGTPGCARSPKLNGFDWVLQRVCADVPVTKRDIMQMGAGGLLMEIASRPQPRAGAQPAIKAPRIAAIVLAAGQARRMGANKLLAEVGGQAMVARIVDQVRAAQVGPVVVVTGHEAEKVRAAVTGKPVTFVHNPDYAVGLSTSLAAGVAALPPEADGAVICLGDMPRVTTRHIDKLIAAFNPLEGRAICVPTVKGKRGNPVLWAKEFFPAMRHVAGDTGAKHLIGEHADQLCEVPIEDDGVLVDIDTPDALAALRKAVAVAS